MAVYCVCLPRTSTNKIVEESKEEVDMPAQPRQLPFDQTTTVVRHPRETYHDDDADDVDMPVLVWGVWSWYLYLLKKVKIG